MRRIWGNLILRSLTPLTHSLRTARVLRYTYSLAQSLTESLRSSRGIDSHLLRIKYVFSFHRALVACIITPYVHELEKRVWSRQTSDASLPPLSSPPRSAPYMPLRPLQAQHHPLPTPLAYRSRNTRFRDFGKKRVTNGRTDGQGLL